MVWFVLAAHCFLLSSVWWLLTALSYHWVFLDDWAALSWQDMGLMNLDCTCVPYDVL